MSSLHITSKGDVASISELSDEHLMNIIDKQKIDAKFGIKVPVEIGRKGTPWYYTNTFTYYGQEALDEMKNWKYVDEAKKRGLL